MSPFLVPLTGALRNTMVSSAGKVYTQSAFTPSTPEGLLGRGLRANSTPSGLASPGYPGLLPSAPRPASCLCPPCGGSALRLALSSPC